MNMLARISASSLILTAALCLLSLAGNTLQANDYYASSSYAGNPSGSWRGGWSSTKSGHHGPMRVTITPRCDGQYDARFTGRFAVIIPFTYKVTMTPVAVGPDSTTLYAQRRLPLMGNYQMTAVVQGNQLNAAYTSKSDYGSFNMRRSR